MLLRSKKLIKPKQNKLKKVKEENNDNNLADVIKKYLFEIDIVDPWVDKDAVKERYGIIISDKVIDNKKYTAVISSVAHKQFLGMSINEWKELVKEDGILYDLKGLIPRELKPLRI